MGEYQLRRNGLQGVGYRFKWIHLFVIVDVLVLIGIFAFAGRWYLNRQGAAALEEKEHERQTAEMRAQRLAAQADSAVAATRMALEAARQDSVSRAEELDRKRAAIEVGYEQVQAEQTKTSQLGSGLFDLRQQAQSAVQQVDNYESELAARQAEIARADSAAARTAQHLEVAQTQLAQSKVELKSAHQAVAYEPRSVLPSRSGVAFRQEVRDGGDLTNVELQHVLWDRRGTDVGISLGFGLGSGDVESAKQLGVLVSRPLIHRRLGLDLGAGYSVLTDDVGHDNSSPYAAASLRYSPFYQERFHFGLGARADQDGVAPFVGISLGRR
jgi:hypothetical protein